MSLLLGTSCPQRPEKHDDTSPPAGNFVLIRWINCQKIYPPSIIWSKCDYEGRIYIYIVAWLIGKAGSCRAVIFTLRCVYIEFETSEISDAAMRLQRHAR